MATVNQNAQPLVPSSTCVSKVRRETIEKAVRALLKWKEVQSKSQKPQLLPDDEFLYLVLSLKKIPPKSTSSRTNPHKIPLPNPLVLHDSNELCLIIDDRPSSKLTSELAKQKIKNEGVPVSKVLRLSKLKTDYKAFEAKRKLCDSYDLFFADKRVVTLLPKLLGKQFFKKRKLPLPVDLTHKNWKEQIDRACCSALLYLRTGTCSVVRVGRVSMERDEIVENVSAAIDGIVEFVPKKWAGVRSLHLKFSESVPLPVYQALPDMKLKIQGVVNNDETVSGGEIVVKKDEKSGLRKKGRIQEVRYMDAATTAVTAVSEDDELGSEGESDDDIGSAELVSKKRKNGVVGKEEVVNDDTGSAGKKRRKGDSLKKEVVSKNIRKQAKKTTKGDDKEEQMKGASTLSGIEESGMKGKKKGYNGTALKVKKSKKQSAV